MVSIGPKSCGWFAVSALLMLFGCSELIAAPPKVDYLFPAGGQRGQSVQITLAGDTSTWPVQVWSDHPGVSAAAEEKKGQVAVQIAADAEPGVAWLRFHNAEGASALLPFVVGALTEAEEKEPNDAPSNPQQVAVPSVMNGRLQKGGDVDSFAVTLKKGETLIAALQAHSILGSPVDAVMQVCQVTERRALADAPPTVEAYVVLQEHDSVGLDPRLVFTAPADGKYLVRVFGFPSEPNSSIAFAGGQSFVYRLTFTTGPYVAASLPMAVQAGQSSEVQLLGWNLPAAGLHLNIPPASTQPSEGQLSPLRSPVAYHADAVGAAQLAEVPHPSIVAQPDNTPDQPQAVSPPLTVSGQLAQPGAAHGFAFEGKKGQKVRVEVAASSLGFPWDAYVAILDDAGKVLVENDDAKRQRDPEIVFSPPADGKFRAVIRDLNSSGGLAFVYRLTIQPVQPDFALTLAADQFVLPADKPLEIPVTIDRRDGFAEPITVRAVGLPEGVACEEVTSEPKGDSSKAVKLVLKAPSDLTAAVSGVIRIEGASAAIQSPRSATFPLSKPLTGDHSAVWLTITRPEGGEKK